MVEKVDDMFFLDFALNLCLSLGTLCSSIYSITIGEFTYGDNIFNAILASIVTLLIQLPPSVSLHSKVTSYFVLAVILSHVQTLVMFINLIKKLFFFTGSQYG